MRIRVRPRPLYIEMVTPVEKRKKMKHKKFRGKFRFRQTTRLKNFSEFEVILYMNAIRLLTNL